MTIVRIKHNDPRVKSLAVTRDDKFDDRAWRRLGTILGENTTLEELYVREPLHRRGVTEMCDAGLRSNRCVRELTVTKTDLRRAEGVGGLAPFLRGNPRLTHCSLTECRRRKAGLDILSDALSNRSCDTLETLDLSLNHFGDLDLDGLVRALSGAKSFRELFL